MSGRMPDDAALLASRRLLDWEPEMVVCPVGLFVVL